MNTIALLIMLKYKRLKRILRRFVKRTGRLIKKTLNIDIEAYALYCKQCKGDAFYYDHKPEKFEIMNVSDIIRTTRFPDFKPKTGGKIICQSCGKVLSASNTKTKWLKKVILKSEEVII